MIAHTYELRDLGRSGCLPGLLATPAWLSNLYANSVETGRRNGDGTWSGGFSIPDLHASLLKAFLERLCAPRRLSRNAAGETVSDETVETGVNHYEQRGRAFTELIEHLPT